MNVCPVRPKAYVPISHQHAPLSLRESLVRRAVEAVSSHSVERFRPPVQTRRSGALLLKYRYLEPAKYPSFSEEKR